MQGENGYPTEISVFQEKKLDLYLPINRFIIYVLVNVK